MIDEMVARLNAQVPSLNGRAEGVLALMDLLRSNRLPENATAMIYPAGFRGLAPTDATGVFSQALAESYGVVLVISSRDKVGRKALEKINPHLRSVMSALAGWAPPDATGVFQVSSGRPLSFKDGRLMFELVFSINTNLRVHQ